MNGKSKTSAFGIFTEFPLLTTKIANKKTLKCIPLKQRWELNKLYKVLGGGKNEEEGEREEVFHAIKYLGHTHAKKYTPCLSKIQI